MLTPLPWDSDFWGLDVARADGPADTDADLVYLLVDAGRPDLAQAAEANGFRFMDVRVTLEREMTQLYYAPARQIREPRPDEVDALAQIARTAHQGTRFYADPLLPDERCDDLYETWLRNECAGTADRIFVSVGAEPNGYISARMEDGVATIGLIAVASDARGRGYGSALVAAAVRFAWEHSALEIRVATQGANVPALRLYQSAGFRVVSTELWFHRRRDAV